MRNVILIVLVVVAAASVAAAAVAGGLARGSESVPIATAVVTEPGEPANVTLEQARNADAGQYAADHKVTLGEARSRLAAQPSLDSALDRLERSFPERYAGGWIEHAPSYRAVARFKGVVPPGAGDVAGPNVALRGGAARSLAELTARADEVYEAVADLWGETVATTFDEQTGGIELSLEVPTNLQALSDAQLRGLVPETARRPDVRLGFSDTPVYRSQHTYGGALLSGPGGSCTSGFGIRRLSDGAGGVLTAGHCSNDFDYFPADGSASYDTDWVDGHRGDYGDVQWHTTDHSEFAEFYDSSSGRREVHGSISSWHNGDYICHYGRYGGYDCSDVHDTNVSVTDDDGFHLKKLVEVDDNITVSGDSGGPWFLGYDAGGIHSGVITNAWGTERSAFSKIGYADDALPGIALLVTN
jgi:streptogrisin C